MLYILIVGISLIYSPITASNSAAQISYGLPVLRSEQQDHYEITNHAGQKIGKMDCTLSPCHLPSSWIVFGRYMLSNSSRGPVFIRMGNTRTPSISSGMQAQWIWCSFLSGKFSNPPAYLTAWNESENLSDPLTKLESLRIYDDEQLKLTGQGKITMRKISIGKAAAWYAKNDSLAGLIRPVKFDDGILVYSLAE